MSVRLMLESVSIRAQAAESIAGSRSNSAFLEYEGAVTWKATAHLVSQACRR